MIVVTENKLYTIFAKLFTYPWDDLTPEIEECEKALLDRPEYPEKAVEELRAFAKKAKDIPLDDLQGEYSYTFEISTGDFTLDLGYHLLDGFKRANNLLYLKETYREHGFPVEEVTKGELPDNLTVILKFLDFVKDERVRNELRENFLIKALEKLAKNFENKKDNLYYHLIQSLLAIVDVDVKAVAGEGKTDVGK